MAATQAKAPPAQAEPDADTHVTWVRLRWAGKARRFLLNPRDLEAPLTATADPALHRIRPMLDRLTSGSWGTDDVVRPIRLALQGGGDFNAGASAIVRLMEPYPDLTALLDKHLHGRPLADNVLLAVIILRATIFGVPEDLAGKGLTPADFLAKLVGAPDLGAANAGN